MPASAPSALLSRHHRLSRLSRLLRCLLPGVLLRYFLLAAFCFAVCLSLRLHAAACSAATCIAVSCSPPARRPAPLPSASLSVSPPVLAARPAPDPHFLRLRQPPPVPLLFFFLLRRSLGSLRAGSRLRSRHFRFRSFFSAPFPFDLCLLLLLFLRFYRLLFHGLLPPLRLSPAPSFSSFPPPSSASFSPLLSSFSPFPRPFRLPAACSAPPHTKTPPPITAGVRNVAREPITPRVFRGRC